MVRSSVLYDSAKIACLSEIWFFSMNQFAVFFDHQYIWKESLDFLPGDNYQGKIASETNTLDWVWQVVIFIQSDCRIL